WASAILARAQVYGIATEQTPDGIRLVTATLKN
ncbi:MAG TPA: citrate lyase subunit beta, partial [Enterobacteriaceae bacterium]|nr:citrate lyase subunit beta [Enterobacteriaceae bacterium]